VPDIGATYFRLVFHLLFRGIADVASGWRGYQTLVPRLSTPSCFISGSRQCSMVIPPMPTSVPSTSIASCSFRGFADMASDLCGRQISATCVSTSPAFEAPPIWRQDCGCAKHRRNAVHLVRLRGSPTWRGIYVCAKHRCHVFPPPVLLLVLLRTCVGAGCRCHVFQLLSFTRGFSPKVSGPLACYR